MGLIDISNFLIIKPEQLEYFLINIGSNLSNSDPTYPTTLLLSNVFAYMIIIAFIFGFSTIIRNTKRRIRRMFT